MSSKRHHRRWATLEKLEPEEDRPSLLEILLNGKGIKKKRKREGRRGAGVGMVRQKDKD